MATRIQKSSLRTNEAVAKRAKVGVVKAKGKSVAKKPTLAELNRLLVAHHDAVIEEAERNTALLTGKRRL